MVQKYICLDFVPKLIIDYDEYDNLSTIPVRRNISYCSIRVSIRGMLMINQPMCSATNFTRRRNSVSNSVAEYARAIRYTR